jgi:ribosomal protein S30
MNLKEHNPRMVSDILTAISDVRSLVLFNTIALIPAGTDILIRKSGLTRRQYYSRLSSLTKAGLISKQNGKYFLTSFGKVVYDTQKLIGKAKDNLWRLRAIDSFQSSDRRMSTEELSKIIEKIIVEDDLKEILLGRKQTNLVEKQPLGII